MANMICTLCGKVLRKGIQTATGLDSDTLCPDCEKALYESTLQEYEADGILTESLRKFLLEKIAEIEGGEN